MIDFVIDHPYCALFVDMGCGKTVTTLTALQILREDYLDVAKTLVIAPKSVAQNTWTNECEKWDHLKDTRVSVVMGTAAQRRRALEVEADLYITNRDNVTWLVDEYLGGDLRMKNPWPFDCVVLDESSSFKSWTSKRFKHIMKMRPFMRRVIELTGTPSPNGLMDLWAQLRILDMGERLGRGISGFRDKYFRPGARNGAVVYDYRPKPGAKEEIARKISDICLSMQASDYLEMPMVMDGGMTLTLEEIVGYRLFEKDCVMSLPEGDIVAVTAVALMNKLLQFASGAVYDDEHNWHPVSDTKLEALDELIEQAGEPVLVYYNYQHERERILGRHPEAVCFKGEPEILKKWNEGQIPVLLCHPASVAYGLNMQHGGHIIIWYSPTWNLELYLQANARLNRQGQTKPVIMYHLICRDTMDEVVMTALRGKGDTQAALLRHIKKLRNQ